MISIAPALPATVAPPTLPVFHPLLLERLSELLDESPAKVGCDHVGFHLLGPDGRRLDCQAVSSGFRYAYLAYGLDLTNSDGAAQALQSGEPVAVSDAFSGDFAGRDAADRQGLRSFLYAPVSTSGRPVGVLAFSCQQVHEWTAQETAECRRVAVRCGELLVEPPVPAAPASHVASRDEERLRAMLAATPGLAFAVKADLTPYETAGDARGLTLDKVFGERGRGAEAAAAVAEICAGRRAGFEALLEGDAGLIRVNIRPIIVGGQVEGAAVFCTDLTEVLKAKAALDAARYLDSLGRIATSVSHEFNNILQVLSSSLDSLAPSVRGPLGRELLQVAEDAIERGAKLAMQLLTFSRAEPPSPEVVNLVGFLTGAWQTFENAVGPERSLELVVRGSARVKVDKNHLHVAMLNLCLNARDATPLGGVVTMEVSRLEEGGANYVALSVTDRGMGMTEDVLRRATEPFFTTKPQGAGTGLGLSTVRAVAETHGGQLRLRSEIGVGTTAMLCLPVFAPAVAAAIAPVEPSAPVDAPLPEGFAKTNRVMVIDDEEAITNWMEKVLRRSGCEVRTWKSAADAKASFKLDPTWPDLVVLDMTLPDGSGADIYSEFRSRRPELPFLVCSGYGEIESIRRIVKEGHERLTKPCSRGELEAAVARGLLRRAQA